MPVTRGTWSMERVVAELRRLHAGGEPINRVALLDGGHASLVAAAERYCVSFGRAVKLAGFPPQPARPAWSAKRVVEELRRRHQAGEPLNSEELRSTGDAGLVSAATKYVGSWRKAIAKAGVPAFKRGLFKSWDDVCAELRAVHAKGIKMSTSQMREHGLAALVDAAKLEAGSWNNALEQAGIPVVMTYERWRPGDVVKRIRALRAEGVALSSNLIIARGERKLVKAATRHFGTWTAACQRAVPGYKPLLEHWTVDRLLELIRVRHNSSASMRSTDVQKEEPTLTAAARRLGLPWRTACRRAGVPAAAIRARVARQHARWTPATIIAILKQAAHQGTPLLVKSFRGSFVTAVLRRFKAWADAMAAAGLARQYRRDHKAALANRLGGQFLVRSATRA